MSKAIKGALRNLSKAENPDLAYCKGIVVGIMAALHDQDYVDFDTALRVVRNQLPADFITEAFPEGWLDEDQYERYWFENHPEGD